MWPFKRKAPVPKKADEPGDKQSEEAKKQSESEDETPFVRKARGSAIPKRAQRVFVCYAVGDSGDRDRLVADVLSYDAGVDCVVTYLKQPGMPANEALLKNELYESSAMVVLISDGFLNALDQGTPPWGYSLAKVTGGEIEVPVIPIVVDTKLFDRFTKLHGIAMTDREYREKLKAQLGGFVLSEELIKEIASGAFSAKLFLSYRKKNLTQARAFMASFYQIPGFETIAIWYDNFLQAGHFFDEEIKESIINGDAFILLVTPELMEPGNYVLTEEYPFAKDQTDKRILAIEAAPTDRESFVCCYPGVDAFTPLGKMEEAFRRTLPEGAFEQQTDSMKRFLLGMAFLKGIQVQKNTALAIQLLSKVAQGNDEAALRASEQLANCYEFGFIIKENDDEALRWRKRCLEVSIWLFGGRGAKTATAYNNLALVYEKTGDYKSAMDMYKEDLSICLETLGAEHPDTATTYNNMAILYVDMGDNDEAVELHQLALSIRQRTLPPEHRDTAASYNNLALVYQKKGAYAKAAEGYHNAIAIRERLQGGEHMDTAMTYMNYGSLLVEMGQYEEGKRYCKRAVKVVEDIWGEDHINAAPAYSSLSGVYEKTGEYEKALELIRKAPEITKRVRGGKHPDLATYYNNMALVLCHLGRQDQARTMAWQALEINLEAGEKGYTGGVNIHSILGQIAHQLGEYNQALELFGKDLAAAEQTPNGLGPESGKLFINMAASYRAKGEYAKAFEMYARALKCCDRFMGPEHPDTAVVYNGLGVLYRHCERLNEAVEMYEKALAICEESLGQVAPLTSNVYNNMALVQQLRGDYQSALAMYEKTLNATRHIYGPEHSEMGVTYGNIAHLRLAMGDTQGAIEMGRKGLDVLENSLGSNHPSTALAYNNMANFFIGAKAFEQAVPMALQAFNVWQQTLGLNHPYTQSAFQNLGAAYVGTGHTEEEFYRLVSFGRHQP